MSEMIQACAGLFSGTLDAVCGVDLFRLLALLLVFRVGLAVLLMAARNAKRL